MAPSEKHPPEKQSPPPKREKVISAPIEITPLPTTFVDSFFLSYWSENVKIIFGETIDGKEYWRSAVILPLSDAEALSKRLAEAIAEVKAKSKKETS